MMVEVVGEAVRSARVKKPIDAIEAQGDSSFQSAELYGDDVIRIRISGQVAMRDGVTKVTQRVRDWTHRAQSDVTVFFDLEGFTRYESEVRLRYTETIRFSGSKVTRVVVFADSKLVKMGAQVAGLVLPQLKLVSRSEFDRTFDERIER